MILGLPGYQTLHYSDLKEDVRILHAGTNGSVSRTSPKIFDDLLQLKSATAKTLSNCQVIFLQRTRRVDNGKTALPLRHLNEHFSELNLDVVNNTNIKVKHIDQKGLHLNPEGKSRLALNLMHKTRGLWWSSEHLNVPTKPYISTSKSLNKKNICNLRTSEILNYITCEGKHLENNCSDLSKNRINKNENSGNTLQKPTANNPLRINVGQLNINSLRNKLGAVCKHSQAKNRHTFGFWN